MNYDGSVSYNRNHNKSSNLSEISTVSTDQLTSSNLADVNTKIYNLNISQSVTIKKKLDSIGSEWTTDAAVTFTPNEANQDFITYFYYPAQPETKGDGKLKNSFNFYSLQTNLARNYLENYV